ncbi:hypothetical protein M231_04650 [Tremella mesenterica]|uniref:RanBP2-type domain-containing protein n=1 Tax=Tremella mesenterica TaxID=5217 RepID=A0A4Q1BK16_TREME|nr:hypothetical protein M231_04650 [Tremella mesenterica]
MSPKPGGDEGWIICTSKLVQRSNGKVVWGSGITEFCVNGSHPAYRPTTQSWASFMVRGSMSPMAPSKGPLPYTSSLHGFIPATSERMSSSRGRMLPVPSPYYSHQAKHGMLPNVFTAHDLNRESTSARMIPFYVRPLKESVHLHKNEKTGAPQDSAKLEKSSIQDAEQAIINIRRIIDVRKLIASPPWFTPLGSVEDPNAIKSDNVHNWETDLPPLTPSFPAWNLRIPPPGLTGPIENYMNKQDVLPEPETRHFGGVGQMGLLPVWNTPSPLPAGDWRCPRDGCGYANFGRNKSCRRCTEARPVGIPPPLGVDGDWVCLICGFTNGVKIPLLGDLGSSQGHSGSFAWIPVPPD